MGLNRLPKTVTRQHRDCDLNPGPSAPKSSTLTTQLPSHPSRQWYFLNGTPHSATSKCSYNFKISYRHFHYHKRKRINNYATLLSKKKFSKHPTRDECRWCRSGGQSARKRHSCTSDYRQTTFLPLQVRTNAQERLYTTD